MTTYTITAEQLQQLLACVKAMYDYAGCRVHMQSYADQSADSLALLNKLQPNTQEPVAWMNTAGKSTLLTTRQPHEDYGTVVEHWLPLYTHPAPQDSDEPRLSDLFCGVDVTGRMLSVSVLRRRSDDVAEVLHSEQFEVPQAKPLTDEQIYEMYSEPRSDTEMVEFARAIEAAHGVKP